MDPRTRVVMTLGYLLAVALARQWTFLALLLWTVATWARVWPWRLWVGSLVAVPFALAALPLPFTVPGPGWSCGPVHGSWEGTWRLATVLIRSLLSVQAALLLTTTTPWPRLLWAFSRLGLPSILTSVLLLMVRYLEVLRAEVSRRLCARASRSAQMGKAPGLVFQARMAGGMAGGLMLRTLDRSERVYQAMLSRGYDGRPRLLEEPALRGWDWLAILATLGLLCWR